MHLYRVLDVIGTVMRRHVFRVFCLAMMLPALALFSEPAAAEVTYKEIKNPVYVKANDPWVVKHEDAYYYVFSDNGINVKQIRNINKIKQSGAARVWTPPKEGPCAKEIWAPEMHYIDGEWYIYFAASDGNNDNHRMYVLKGTSQDPTAPFEFVGRVTDVSDHWAIDGTTFLYKGERYFVWSGWEGTSNGEQRLYIAHMNSPVSVDSERVCIAKPEYDWEMVEMPIEEGPEILVDEEKECVLIVYSASGSWTDHYCMGMLRLQGEDLLSAASWVKEKEPVFSGKEGAYGPGHGCFVEARDGSLWMVYHCNQFSGTGWDGRSAWLQPVFWDGETLEMDGPVVRDDTMQLPE